MDDPRVPDPGATPVLVLSEERARLVTQRLPYRKLRVAKRVVVEQQTVVVDVRREELVVEEVELDDASAIGAAETADEPLVLVLSREVVEGVQLRTEPVELVRVHVDRGTGLRDVEAELRHEQAEVEVRR